MKPDNTQETIYVGLDTGLPPYLPYPRFLLKMDISQTAKLLYALLLDRTTLSQRNGWQDDQGRTFIVYPIVEIAEILDKGQTAIKAALNELDAAGLLERKRAGFSSANRLYVKLPPLVRISDPMTVGKATLIRSENRPTDGRKTDLTASFEGRNEYISRLCRYPLLILDDFGMERGTEYGLEQIYSVIDSRYRSHRPLIVTTNLTLQQIQNPPDTAHARIYDRLLEMCAPVRFTGGNFRRETAQAKLERLKNLMNE